jgi:hypothetical protein
VDTVHYLPQHKATKIPPDLTKQHHRPHFYEQQLPDSNAPTTLAAANASCCSYSPSLLPQNRKPRINKIKTFSPSLYRLSSSVSSSTTKTPTKKQERASALAMAERREEKRREEARRVRSLDVRREEASRVRTSDVSYNKGERESAAF